VPRKRATPSPAEPLEPTPEPLPRSLARTTTARNPLEPRPNIRLRRRFPGGPAYPALPYVRLRGEGVVYDLPLGDDGKPDQALQERGWYDAYAHRITSDSAVGKIHYQPIRDKGVGHKGAKP
jgi:hypothetical protein